MGEDPIITFYVAARFWWFWDHLRSIFIMKNDSTKFQLLKLSIKEFGWQLLCYVQYGPQRFQGHCNGGLDWIQSQIQSYLLWQDQNQPQIRSYIPWQDQRTCSDLFGKNGFLSYLFALACLPQPVEPVEFIELRTLHLLLVWMYFIM